MTRSPIDTARIIDRLIAEAGGGRPYVRELSARLLIRRYALGLTQEDVAGPAGLSVQSLSMYENGHREPLAPRLVALATALDTSASYLLGETDDPTPLTN